MKKDYKNIFAALIGNALEYYDVMLYGFFATMLAPLFFPTENPTLSIISSFGTFAAGFVMRPLGGILFGHFGDKIGRLPVLAVAIFLVTIPTFIIGVLPTYEQIGIAAPIILITCRLLQGLCVGGEYSGAAIFIIEHSKKNRAAFAGSILCSAGFFGGVIGTFISFLCTLSFMPTWAWRIPFLVGSIIGLLGYRLRTQIKESPDFLKVKDEPKNRIPLLTVFQNHKRNLLCTMGIGATSLIPFYIASVYFGHLLVAQMHVSYSQMMLINIGINIFIMIILPFMGITADRVGREKFMIFFALSSIVVAFIMAFILHNNLSVSNIILIQFILAFVAVGFSSSSSALLTTLFPVHERYSGIGFGYAFGGALLGGTAPLVVTSLAIWFSPALSASIYLCLSGLLGAVCVNYAQKAEDK